MYHLNRYHIWDMFWVLIAGLYLKRVISGRWSGAPAYHSHLDFVHIFLVFDLFSSLFSWFGVYLHFQFCISFFCIFKMVRSGCRNGAQCISGRSTPPCLSERPVTFNSSRFSIRRLKNKTFVQLWVLGGCR